MQIGSATPTALPTPLPNPLPGESGNHLVQLVWSGRFGNRMFAYAYGCALAAQTGTTYWMPAPWEGSRLFARQRGKLYPGGGLVARMSDQNPQVNAVKHKLVQRYFPGAEFVDAEGLETPFAPFAGTRCHANSCLYNPAIFAGLSRRFLQQEMAFSEEVQATAAWQYYSARQGTYDVAHLRRDDIANPQITRHGCAHSVVSQESYHQAFARFGVSADQVLWVSDDYLGHWHQGRPVRPRGGYRYPEGSEHLPGLVFDWLEDFLCLYFARRIFRANSSFSWWAATLAPHAQVYSPVIDRECIYGVDGTEELLVDFVEGNHPHWTYNCPDVHIAP